MLRLSREILKLQSDPPSHITATPIDSNLYNLEATIIGPSETPYTNGIFKLELVIPEAYPYAPPKVRFITRIFHVNISQNGDICLDILKHKWTPALSIEGVLVSIQSLLSDANSADPLNHDAAELYRNNAEGYNSMASDYTRRYASGNDYSEIEPLSPLFIPDPPELPSSFSFSFSDNNITDNSNLPGIDVTSNIVRRWRARRNGIHVPSPIIIDLTGDSDEEESLI